MLSSDFQEYLLSIHEVHEEPEHEHVADGVRDGVVLLRQQAEDAVEETVVQLGEVDEARRHVDEDGVHADDLEVEVPLPPSAHIYYKIEEGKHDERVACDGQDEGAAPEGLVDGVDDVPCGTQQGRDDACGKEHEGRARRGFAALNKDTGEHSQHGGTDGGQGGEQAFGVVVWLVAMGTQQGAVDVAGNVTFAGQGVYRRIDSGRMDKGRDQPVAYQYDGDHSHLGPQLLACCREDKGGKHPCQSDASQDAGPAKRFELEPQEAADHQSQEDQDEASAQDLQVDARRGLAFLLLLLERKGEGDAGDEEEQREDGVVVNQSVPRHMLHVSGYRLPHGRVGEEGGDGCEQRSAAGDEEHVEASQRIQRLEPLACLFLLHGDSFSYFRKDATKLAKPYDMSKKKRAKRVCGLMIFVVTLFSFGFLSYLCGLNN